MYFNIHYEFKINRMILYIADIFDGLLLSSKLGRSTFGISRKNGDFGAEHLDVSKNLEARHVLSQRQAELSPHNHEPQ